MKLFIGLLIHDDVLENKKGGRNNMEQIDLVENGCQGLQQASQAYIVNMFS